MPASYDDLWPEFAPIWIELSNLAPQETLQIAGGYGLFLKQSWLIENSDVAIVIPFEQWRDPAPRATNDFDLLLGLDFIATEIINREIKQILQQNGFAVTRKRLGQRWQFVKYLPGGRVILAELHAPTPKPGAENLRVEDIRIKHKPSLGRDGVHGRRNREAEGCELHPFEFNLNGVSLAVPNPVTWSVMKLTAMHSFWLDANDPNRDPEDRTKARKQAEKHAQDVCRTIAMMTREESEHASEIIGAIRETEAFQKAVTFFAIAFREEKWAQNLVVNYWEVGDLEIILQTLDGLFA